MLSTQQQSELLLHCAKGMIDGQPLADVGVLAETLALAKENDIYFYVLSLLLSQSHLNDVAGSLKAEHARLTERQHYVEQEAVRLQKFFAGRDLPVFFIKDFMKYPFTDHDIDFVAVRKSLLATYRAGMKEIGCQYRFGKSQIREPDKYFYYPLCERSDFADIRFHLHKALSWNGVVFLNSESVLAQCRDMNGDGGTFLVPGYEDEILIMAAHAVFENASIRIGEILQLGLIVRDERIRWDYIIETATEYNWQVGLAFFLEAAWTSLLGARSLGPTDSIHEWGMKTLSDAGIRDVHLSGDRVFPYEIPYTSCMRLYIDKMRRDIRNARLGGKALFWEGLSFFVSVWFSRLKKRMR